MLESPNRPQGGARGEQHSPSTLGVNPRPAPTARCPAMPRAAAEPHPPAPVQEVGPNAPSDWPGYRIVSEDLPEPFETDV